MKRNKINPMTFEPELIPVIIEDGTPYGTARPFDVACHIMIDAWCIEQVDCDWLKENCEQQTLITNVLIVNPIQTVIEFESKGDAKLFKLAHL